MFGETSGTTVLPAGWQVWIDVGRVTVLERFSERMRQVVPTPFAQR